jgi:hypothetical protein
MLSEEEESIVGLCVALQRETGEQIELVADEKNILPSLLESLDESAFPMLAYIDRYGDTIFNRLQLGRFLAEWRMLFSLTTSAEERALLDAIRRLAENAAGGVHLYVAFIGD